MQALTSPLSLHHFPPNPRLHVTLPRLLRALSSSASASAAGVSESGDQRLNYSGVRLEETVVEAKSGKVRLDAWISSRILGISRARVQASIRAGLVAVNGRVVDKVSHAVRKGDVVECTISELQPLRADPEEIPLDIVYEDDHVLVVNKPAHMVVHPAPGNPTGTLVNAILNHCSLPTIALYNNEDASEAEDTLDEDNLDDDFSVFPANQMSTEGTTFGPSIRPGIVHRLDKGTSGLLVVAKDELSHAHLSQQFKERSVSRVYLSLTSGVPSPAAGRVEIPIGRDVNNRIRMTAVTGPNRSRNVRHAANIKWWKCWLMVVLLWLNGDWKPGAPIRFVHMQNIWEFLSWEMRCMEGRRTCHCLSTRIRARTCTSLALCQLISLKCCISFVQFENSWWLNTELYASGMMQVEREQQGYKAIFTILIEHVGVVH
ncbi:hypothetical protein Droror1_Dr00015729 [Drosera rotundifolia]